MYSAFIRVAVSAQEQRRVSSAEPSLPIKPTHLIQAPVNNAVNCYDYVALMMNE